MLQMIRKRFTVEIARKHDGRYPNRKTAIIV
jgi:hypothetical protein